MDYVRKNGLKRIVIAAIGLGFAVLPAAVLFLPERASGTDEMMRSLPAFATYQCAICHTSAAPTLLAHQLNVFGVDFEANGSVWNPTLALLNSDGDRCSNGTELGDRDGDGEFDDASEPIELANPGNPSDCTAPIDKRTWGYIKELFNKIDDYSLEEHEYEYFALYFGS